MEQTLFMVLALYMLFRGIKKYYNGHCYYDYNDKVLGILMILLGSFSCYTALTM